MGCNLHTKAPVCMKQIRNPAFLKEVKELFMKESYCLTDECNNGL
jgi:hypothetical protein